MLVRLLHGERLSIIIIKWFMTLMGLFTGGAVIFYEHHLVHFRGECLKPGSNIGHCILL